MLPVVSPKASRRPKTHRRCPKARTSLAPGSRHVVSLCSHESRPRQTWWVTTMTNGPCGTAAYPQISSMPPEPIMMSDVPVRHTTQANRRPHTHTTCKACPPPLRTTPAGREDLTNYHRTTLTNTLLIERGDKVLSGGEQGAAVDGRQTMLLSLGCYCPRVPAYIQIY